MAGVLTHEKLLTALVADIRPSAEESRGIDWEAFTVAAVRHGVAQWIGPRLAGLPIPDPYRACLERVRRANDRRNEVLLAAAGRLALALHEGGVDFRVLKGAALAVTIYPDPADRPFADIDILVHSADFARAADAADRAGFVRAGPAPYEGQTEITYTASAGEDILTATMAHEYDPAAAPEKLARDRDRIKVEIHRGLYRYANGFLREGDDAAFFDNPVAFTLPGGAPARTLCAEATLVHLAQHAAHHGFARLLFPLDVRRLLAAGPDLDWQLAARIAERAGETDNVARMLALVAQIFGSEALPSAASALLGAPRRAARIAVDDVFRAMDGDRGDVVLKELVGGDWRKRLAMARRMLAPPPEFLEQVHGSGSRLRTAVLYAYRPFYLAGRLAQIVARRRSPSRKGGR